MCGIYLWFGDEYKYSEEEVDKHRKQANNYERASKLKHRGPDSTKTFFHIRNQLVVEATFHRLAIMDPSPAGNQPMYSDDCSVMMMCNGEIYNAFTLAQSENIVLKSRCDCEIILELYQKYGFSETVQKLQGYFAIVLVDFKKPVIYAARDWIGVRPLFIAKHDVGFAFASEVKSLIGFQHPVQLKPGCVWSSEIPDAFGVYHDWFDVGQSLQTLQQPLNWVKDTIRHDLIRSVNIRMSCDRPKGCFLSGGLDSSLICSLVVSEHLRQASKDPNYAQKSTKEITKEIHTFAIGMYGSTDLVWAKKVADYLGTTHHSIVLRVQTFLDAIEEVIKAIESYDITTVRASIGMYLLSKYIANNTDIRVLFSGEGADEIAQGYLYFRKQPNIESGTAGHEESLRLLKDMQYFDILRADRTTAAHGLELRLPFLDRSFAMLYLSMDPKIRCPQNGVEKWLLRESFSEKIDPVTGKEYLPHDVVWRKKEAFSDGVSAVGQSWHECLDDYGERQMPVNIFCPEYDGYDHYNIGSKEGLLYIAMFERFYPNHGHLIPYKWMPKWVKTDDPSARTLEIYNDDDNDDNDGDDDTKEPETTESKECCLPSGFNKTILSSSKRSECLKPSEPSEPLETLKRSAGSESSHKKRLKITINGTLPPPECKTQ